MKCGFRTICLKDGLFYINGAPLKLKGVNRHDWNEYTGRCVTREDIRRDLYLMKQYQADKVELILKEEKDLIGGFVLKVGDHVYDNSLSGKMRKLQQKLTWR